MTALIKTVCHSDVVRYVFFGGCTTLVNLVSFSSAPGSGVQRDLCKCDLDYSGNSFAYVVNSKFVFSWTNVRLFEKTISVHSANLSEREV